MEVGRDVLKHIVLITEKSLENETALKKECRKQGVSFHNTLPEEETLITETLYITDYENICNQLLSEKANVLVWLHEGNRRQDLSKAPYAVEGMEEVDFTYLKRVYDRYMGNPWTITETKRCIIREMTEEDLEELYEIYAEPSITQFTEGLYEDYEEELEYTRSYIKNAYVFWGYGTWIIIKKDTGKIIGRAGFNTRDGFEYPELGFIIAKPYQNKGYAYEVCRKLLQIGKEDYEFSAVQALVKKENIASMKLCQKLGFERKKQVNLKGETYEYFVSGLAF